MIRLPVQISVHPGGFSLLKECNSPEGHILDVLVLVDTKCTMDCSDITTGVIPELMFELNAHHR